MNDPVSAFENEFPEYLSPEEKKLLIASLSQLHERRDIKLTSLELTSVSALTHYAAHTQEMSGAKVTKATCDAFGVKKLEDICRAEYANVVDFLVNFQRPDNTEN